MLMVRMVERVEMSQCIHERVIGEGTKAQKGK